ncbi:MAG: transposase [Tetrasphaera sp.]|nr:transposase [Tetrasphaera sp.]
MTAKCASIRSEEVNYPVTSSAGGPRSPGPATTRGNSAPLALGAAALLAALVAKSFEDSTIRSPRCAGGPRSPGPATTRGNSAPPPSAQRRALLAALVAKSFEDSEGTYGYRRVHADLLEWGHPCHVETVDRAAAGWRGLTMTPRDYATCKTCADPGSIHPPFTPQAPRPPTRPTTSPALSAPPNSITAEAATEAPFTPESGRHQLVPAWPVRQSQ